ncbi:transcriptional repressor [Caloramator sp. E03]|uniref:Fur family transcriptional regulator n=1 Tax=Caloramator sp. E03 TaxID=2576307 RepID=UPI001110E96D|nr:Fur family transcriptional regulator [Caloramator sp. E03]QCX32732.1 transcriptional repressor [Caloramator sp. E03]
MIVFSKDENEKLKQRLKTGGYKLTPQRRAVLNVIIDNEGKHLSTEEIYDIVKKECPEIGLATVYRTLQLLEKMGLVCRMNFDDGCNRYELIHEEEDHQHHHLVCINCGNVEEVEGDLLETLEEKIEQKYDFKITNHSVKFFGYCSKCKYSK